MPQRISQRPGRDINAEQFSECCMRLHLKQKTGLRIFFPCCLEAWLRNRLQPVPNCVYQRGAKGQKNLGPLFGWGNIKFDQAAVCGTHPDPPPQTIIPYKHSLAGTLPQTSGRPWVEAATYLSNGVGSNQDLRLQLVVEFGKGETCIDCRPHHIVRCVIRTCEMVIRLTSG